MDFCGRIVLLDGELFETNCREALAAEISPWNSVTLNAHHDHWHPNLVMGGILPVYWYELPDWVISDNLREELFFVQRFYPCFGINRQESIRIIELSKVSLVFQNKTIAEFRDLREQMLEELHSQKGSREGQQAG